MHLFWTVIMFVTVLIFFGTCKAVDDHPDQLQKVLRRMSDSVRNLYTRFLAWSMERFDWLPEEQLELITKLTTVNLNMAPPCNWMYITPSRIDPYAVSIGLEHSFHTPVGKPYAVPSVGQFMKQMKRELYCHGWDVRQDPRGNIRAIPPHYTIIH